ncbi:MAG TPA: glycosyltransferase [Gaiellaceae bacterium]|nr:glycosyltransferase [Gaiellaceae bacterium]
MPPLITWAGEQFAENSLAIVNRSLCGCLYEAPLVDLALLCDDPVAPPPDPRVAALARAARRRPRRAADVHVRHYWPPSLEPPLQGRWVLIQPWEYGSIPRRWVRPLDRLVDEVWVPSTHVRDGFVRSGVAAERVVVVPNGVDFAFNPSAPMIRLETEKAFRFLFVGGTLHRKGADVLLEAYLEAFQADDDVCLVVKDFGTRTFYRDQGLRERILAASRDPRSPEILYTDEDLPREHMPALYTACQCLVAPYRAEGFCLPLAEAMACGLAVIAPDYGACLDYCDSDVAFLVPAEEVDLGEPLPEPYETVEPLRSCEVDRAALVRAMREVAAAPASARELGLRASAKIHRDYSWEQAAATALDRLLALAEQPVRRFTARPYGVSALGRYPELLREVPRGAEPSPEVEPQLSVCLVVRDEEERLPACLESVRGLADELVVVDTGSTDRTVEIARAYGARVFRVPWQDDFARVRNEYLQQATKDWILALDADNELDPEGHAEIRRLIRTNELVGYAPQQISPLAEGGMVEHRDVRLFPRHPELRYVGRVHSQVLPAHPDLPYRVAPCDVVLRHHGWSRPGGASVSAFYLGAIEAEAREEPDEPFHAYNLGAIYHQLGRYAEAEQELRRCVELSQPVVGEARLPTFLPHAYLLLAHALISQGWPAEAAGACRAALEIDPDYPDANCTLGAIQATAGRWPEALASYERALASRARPSLWPSDRGAATWRPRLGIGEILLRCGLDSEALASFEHAVAEAPDQPEAVEALRRAQTGRARLDTAPRGNGNGRIGAVVLARNEEQAIGPALASLAGWVDEIVVLDDGSTDGTARVSREAGALVVAVEHTPHFQARRNLGLLHTSAEWIFVLDADERVPARLAEVLLALVREDSHAFDAVAIPFKNLFCGTWITNPVWYPNYHPRLLRRGSFRFQEAVHSHPVVEGPTLQLPLDEALAIVHESARDLEHYLGKLNRGTSLEAEELLAAGASSSWEQILGRFAQDLQRHFDELECWRDGMPGFMSGIASSSYRLFAWAKLWDLQRQHGRAEADGPDIPRTAAELVAFMARVTEGGQTARSRL